MSNKPELVMSSQIPKSILRLSQKIDIVENTVIEPTYIDLNVGDKVILNVKETGESAIGIFVGAIPYSISVRYIPQTKKLRIENDFLTPLLYVPSLKKSFLGWECIFNKYEENKG